MPQTLAGVFVVGTVTCEASGTATIKPALSNEPFKNLSLTVKPMELNAQYIVTVLFDGEIEEQHTLPDPTGKTIVYMNFPDMIFPPNVGTNVIPAFFQANGFDPAGTGIVVQIQNLLATRATYLVYGAFEEYDNCRFKVVQQDPSP